MTAGDLSLRVADYRFNYRVAAIIQERNRVLLCRSAQGRFCFLPGGRVRAGELALEALRRELSEELGFAAEVRRPVFWVESFFSLEGERFHELCLYFEVVWSEDSGQDLGRLPRFDGDFELLWVDKARLEEVKLKPAFLLERLGDLPPTLDHLVFVEP